MKKHFTLFFIYGAIILAGLSLFLIFYNKKENNEVNNTPQQETESTTPENNGGDNSEEPKKEEQDSTIYATTLTLNCSRTIDINTYSNVAIVGDYITLIPAEAKLNITITAESGNQADLTFVNNTITSKGPGKYRIRFSAPKSKTQELSDTLVINVKENAENYVSTNQTTLTVGDIKEIADIFNFQSVVTNPTIQTNGKLTYSNNKLTAKEVGEATVTILYDVGMFRFKYMATITIKDIPMYKIIVTDVDSSAVINGTNIEYTCAIGKSLHIIYEVRNREEQRVEQLVYLSVDNPLVATCTLTEPMITVKCLSKGVVNLTIVCANDSSSKLTLTITFI